MTWDERIDRIQKVVDLAIRAEVHAFLVLGIGAILILHGQKEQGQSLLVLGAGIFRGNR